MKKLSLLLALLMIISSCTLCACGNKKSSSDDDEDEGGTAYTGAEKVVVDALEDAYKKGDAEKYIESSLYYNLEFLEKIFEADYFNQVKAEVKEDIHNLEEEISEDAEDMAQRDDKGKTKITVKSTYCNKYDSNTKTYEKMLNRLNSKLKAGIEDSLEEVAIVGVLVMYEYTGNGDKKVRTETEKYTCFKVDGDWYIVG